MSPVVALFPRIPIVLLLTMVCLSPASAARAQDGTTEPPAHISFVEGAALLERDGRSETAPSSMPLLAGDRIRTQAGRVEILFDDGSTVHLDSNTIVDFQSDEVIRLLDGRVRLNVTGANRRVSYRVDAPSAWVQVTTPGEYRISLLRGERDAEVELAVLRGAAELVNEDGRTALRAGERAYARVGAAPSYAYVYNSASWDAFDRWSEARRDTRLGVTSEYLPETVQPYAATFSQYGSWNYLPTYGHVWYPRVNYGWRPYYYGRWSTLRPWGWTWIGSDPWAWPTHHYGRWGFSAGTWFWIPGRHWGPAWVSWAYAPNYISWCPLGWNNLPVIGFSSHYFHGGRRWDPWHAWTVVPHHRFATGFVNAHVVHGSTFTPRVRNTFVVRDTAPDFRGHAVPRSTAPITAIGTRSVSAARSNPAAPNVLPRAAVGATRPSAGGADANATFRRRGSDGAPLTGPGYPAPAREPRASAAAPRSRAGAPAIGDATRQGSAVARERGVPAVTPEAGVRAEPRATPRGVEPTSPSISDAPSRRAVPQYRVPSVDYGVPPNNSAPVMTGRPDSGRAVPRGGQDGSAPPSYGGPPPGREMRGGPPPAGSVGAPRAVPRSAPDGPSGPPAGSRSSPGAERSAPSGPPQSGPPPSAAPSRPSGGSSQGAPASARPSSGGGQTTGGAVRRR
jgi:hypothetical protein